jgi:hypothetical protein
MWRTFCNKLCCLYWNSNLLLFLDNNSPILNFKKNILKKKKKKL